MKLKQFNKKSFVILLAASLLIAAIAGPFSLAADERAHLQCPQEKIFPRGKDTPAFNPCRELLSVHVLADGRDASDLRRPGETADQQKRRELAAMRVFLSHLATKDALKPATPRQNKPQTKLPATNREEEDQKVRNTQEVLNLLMSNSYRREQNTHPNFKKRLAFVFAPAPNISPLKVDTINISSKAIYSPEMGTIYFPRPASACGISTLLTYAHELYHSVDLTLHEALNTYSKEKAALLEKKIKELAAIKNEDLFSNNLKGDIEDAYQENLAVLKKHFNQEEYEAELRAYLFARDLLLLIAREYPCINTLIEKQNACGFCLYCDKENDTFRPIPTTSLREISKGTEAGISHLLENHSSSIDFSKILHITDHAFETKRGKQKREVLDLEKAIKPLS